MARKSLANDAADTPEAADTSTQPEETSIPTKERHSAKRKRYEWTNREFAGFELKPPGKTQKRRLSSKQHEDSKQLQDMEAAAVVQDDVFEAGLSTIRCRVAPAWPWACTTSYRRFTIGTAEFQTGDTVFIKGDPSQATSARPLVEDWVAKVLEVRAGDQNHVYLRVYWLYRPEDLPNGRQPYHGINELVASNDMDIVEAVTVNGGAEVMHWQEQQDQGEILDPNQLFWRQTLDVTKQPHHLSELPKHCIDNVPHNPNGLLIQCESCHKWLHGTCIEQAAVREACEEHDVPYPDSKDAAKPKKRKKGKGSVPFVAQLSHSGTGEGARGRLTVTDRRSGPNNSKSWNVPIRCLLCKAVIDEAYDDETTASEPDSTMVDVDKTGSISVNRSGNIHAPQTPANRDISADNDEDSLAGADISSATRPTNPTTVTPLLTNAAATNISTTHGVSAGASEDISPSSAASA